MSRLPEEARTLSAPGPECYCGAELRSVPLSPDLAALSGEKILWVHVATGDTRCYPESSSPEDAAATAEPAQ
jgi:hypothetical protein